MFKLGERKFALILVLFFVSFFNCAKGRHFVLIHGASHGAWCWYKVATLLKTARQNVTTLDLAASGINPKQVQEIRSFSEYNEPLITFLGSLPPEEKVILVGHSRGGISISVAMERFPEKIAVAVFVTAAVITENFTYFDLAQLVAQQQSRNGTMSSNSGTQFFFFDGPNKPPTASLLGPKQMASRMYQLSPAEDKNGRVPKVFIVNNGDKMFPKDIQMSLIGKTDPFAEVKVIKGSDHMVIFSKPKKLCSHFLQIAH